MLLVRHIQGEDQVARRAIALYQSADDAIRTETLAKHNQTIWIRASGFSAREHKSVVETLTFL